VIDSIKSDEVGPIDSQRMQSKYQALLKLQGRYEEAGFIYEKDWATTQRMMLVGLPVSELGVAGLGKLGGMAKGLSGGAGKARQAEAGGGSKVGNVGTKSLAPEYASGFSEANILGVAKGGRPDPSTYLSQSYRDTHAALFQDGAVRIQPTAPTGTIGRTETWVFPKSLADDAIATSRGDARALEKSLGLDNGYLGSAPVRVDIPNPAGYRIPSGNEFGANSFWRPGGVTWPGGLPEAVIHPVPPAGYVVKPVF
jgi:hypothetical protein